MHWGWRENDPGKIHDSASKLKQRKVDDDPEAYDTFNLDANQESSEKSMLPHARSDARNRIAHRSNPLSPVAHQHKRRPIERVLIPRQQVLFRLRRAKTAPACPGLGLDVALQEIKLRLP